MTDWSDGPVRVLIGDVRARLAELPDASVHMVCTSPPYWGLRSYLPDDHESKALEIGLEPTPEMYVGHVVEVFREVRRVLRPDGVVWLNLGDSYAGNRGHADDGDRAVNGKTLSRRRDNAPVPRSDMRVEGLKPKDLVGIPWRAALALQADGWWLRSDVIWAKPNPMPESVTDRPTTAHEHVFLLAKAERYFYDAEAVREADSGQDHRRVALDGQPSLAPPGQQPHSGIRTAEGRNGAGRNLRSVWTIATQPYPEAHFATFPEELARRCIAAGTSERGCCPECGAPWRRVVERQRLLDGETPVGGTFARPDEPFRLPANGVGHWRYSTKMTERGWAAGCTHDREPVPCTVLDPFAGSGATLAVARRMGRAAVGIELQPDYLPLIQARTAGAALPLLEMTVEAAP